MLFMEKPIIKRRYNMGLASMFLSMYKWEKLSDQRLIEMYAKVQSSINQYIELGILKGKDLDKFFDSEREIELEFKKRGIPYSERRPN